MYIYMLDCFDLMLYISLIYVAVVLGCYPGLSEGITTCLTEKNRLLEDPQAITTKLGVSFVNVSIEL